MSRESVHSYKLGGVSRCEVAEVPGDFQKLRLVNYGRTSPGKI